MKTHNDFHVAGNEAHPTSASLSLIQVAEQATSKGNKMQKSYGQRSECSSFMGFWDKICRGGSTRNGEKIGKVVILDQSGALFFGVILFWQNSRVTTDRPVPSWPALRPGPSHLGGDGMAPM